MTEQQTDPDDQYRSRFNERELQREIEEAAEQLDRNTRTLADVFVEHMERGDELEVGVGSLRWTGFILDVGSDVITIDTIAATLDIALRAVSFVRASAVGAGTARARSRQPLSFIAKLRQLSGADAGVVIGLGGERLPTLRGELRAATDSHVELETPDGELIVVSLASISFLSRE